MGVTSDVRAGTVVGHVIWSHHCSGDTHALAARRYFRATFRTPGRSHDDRFCTSDPEQPLGDFKPGSSVNPCVRCRVGPRVPWRRRVTVHVSWCFLGPLLRRNELPRMTRYSVQRLVCTPLGAGVARLRRRQIPIAIRRSLSGSGGAPGYAGQREDWGYPIPDR